MQLNKVKLKCKDQEVSYWENITITSGLNELSRSFSLGVTYSFPKQKKLHDVFKPGDKVQIFIDDDLVLTGYIDQTPIRYNGTSISVEIKGRSQTEDLIDCNPWPEGDPIRLNNDSSNQDSNYIEYAPHSVTSRAKRQAKLGTTLATLIGAYGIKLKAYNDPEIINKLEEIKNISIKPENKLYDIIASIVISEDLLITDDEYGDLLVLKKGYIETGDSLILGKNILSGKADFDATPLFKHYSCSGHKKGDDQTSGKELQTNGISIDDSIRSRYKYLNNVSEETNCQRTADGEKEYLKAQFYKVTYTVQGWRQVTNNELWKINQNVKVTDSMLGFEQTTMLIQKVIFSLSDQGMITTLDLIPPAGIKDKAKKAEKKNIPSNAAKFAQVNDLGLEKNRYIV